MKSFKLNSSAKVKAYNIEKIFPGVGKDGIFVRSIAFTEPELKKLARLRAKYKISKSAIVRVLLEMVEE